MKRLAFPLLTGLLILGLAPGWARASTFTVDQSNTTFDHYTQNAYIDAQTFTAGMYGVLEGDELYLFPSPHGTVSVRLQGTTGSPLCRAARTSRRQSSAFLPVRLVRGSVSASRPVPS